MNTKVTTLKEQLKTEYVEHKEFWNYYGMDSDNPFDSVREAKEFIKNYFEQGCKFSAVREVFGSENEEILFRYQHSVFVFFIGVMLQRKIDDKIGIISEINRTKYPFSYYWFLTCLAHDLGYRDEEKFNENKVEKIIERNGIYLMPENSIDKEKMHFCNRRELYRKEKFNIKTLTPSEYYVHCGLKCNKPTNDEELDIDSLRRMLDGLKYSNNASFRLSWYDGYIKERYFKYRFFKMKKIDHGIIGADKLYSGLVENYHKQYRSNLREGDFNDFKNDRGRHFCSEQFLIFTYICNCIAAHNVYMATEDNRNNYIKYKLKDLLPENFKKISYKKDPLLFILCVADTLEPTKKFKNISVERVINNISIDYDDKENSVVLHIYERLKNVCETERKEYIENVEELEKWCDIKARVVVH